MQPLLLLYGIVEEERIEAYKQLAQQFNYHLVFTGAEDLYKKVGHLLGMEDITDEEEKDQAPVPAIEFVLLYRVPDKDHRELFSYMKAHGIATGNKAIVTETNRHWTLAQLLRENHHEHQVMTMWQNLRYAVDFARKWQDQHGMDSALNDAIARAEHYATPKGDMKLKELQSVYDQLSQEIHRVSKPKTT